MLPKVNSGIHNSSWRSEGGRREGGGWGLGGAGDRRCRLTTLTRWLQVHEKTPLKVKNFGIWLRYDSRSGTHNMYREYRDLTTSGAVTMCCESTRRHSVRYAPSFSRTHGLGRRRTFPVTTLPDTHTHSGNGFQHCNPRRPIRSCVT